MFKTLYGKLAITLFILFATLGAIYLGVTISSTRMFIEEVNQKVNYSLADNLVKQDILLTEGEINEKALKDVFHMLMVVNPSIEVYLLDTSGKVLSYSAPPGKAIKEKVDLEPVKLFLSDNPKLPVLGDDPRGEGTTAPKKIFSAAKVYRGDMLEGYLYIILAGEEYDSAARVLEESYIFQLGTWAVAGGIVFTLMVGLLAFNLLTRRLKTLSEAMDSFKAQEQSTGGKVKSGDEIDTLWKNFKLMEGRINDQLDKLKETDRLRRDLVANISHDLRTPLAALQGYLDTLIIKGSELSGEQKEYLNTAFDQSMRLGRLIEELFELAKLEAKDTKITKEPFSLAELLQDIVGKLKISASENSVALKMDFDETLPFVEGDIALVERVFENLIDNAIRFTSGVDGGEVRLSLREVPDTERILVEVSDNGSGIAEEDIEHVFERFYMAEKSRKADHKGRKGSGLGLAITKEIISLHGSTIKATSKEGKGAVFTFTLPVYRKKT